MALRVVAATANEHKLDEMRAIFGDRIEIVPRPADIAEVVEDAGTFVGNARLKAAAICNATGEVALADDSGLEVDALDGAPGVESAYFAGPEHDDAANRTLMLERLVDVPHGDRAARFRTVLLLRWPNGDEVVAQGTCEGAIGRAEVGSNGFGYDSIFHPQADQPPAGSGRTFAEHTPDEKNAISHRRNACYALLAQLDGE